MNIAGFAAVAAATAATALGERVTITRKGTADWSGPAVVHPDATVDPGTGTPVVATSAYALITHEDWRAGGGDDTGPKAPLRLQQRNTDLWTVRAVLLDGGWWRLEMVAVRSKKTTP